MARDGRVNPLAASMDNEGIAFGGEFLGDVVVDRGFDDTEAQSAENRQSRDPQHCRDESSDSRDQYLRTVKSDEVSDLSEERRV